jgi:hypothetical protein
MLYVNFSLLWEPVCEIIRYVYVHIQATAVLLRMHFIVHVDLMLLMSTGSHSGRCLGRTWKMPPRWQVNR